jgi:hypothetical protein
MDDIDCVVEAVHENEDLLRLLFSVQSLRKIISVCYDD